MVVRVVGITLVLLLVATSAVRRTDADDDSEADIGGHQATDAESSEIDRDHAQSESGTAEREMDPDEFTGSRESGSPPATESRPEKPKVARERSEEAPLNKEQDRMYEIGVGLIVICYLINYVYGRGVNSGIAESWAKMLLADKNICSIGNNFALVWPDNTLALGKTLMRDSCSCFNIYATGRRSCHYLTATLDLQSRQDLFSTVYNQFFGTPATSFDAMNIEVALDEAAMSKFCLAITNNPRKAKAEFNDLETFAEVFKNNKLPKNLVLLTECEEISNEFVRACGTQGLEALTLMQESIDWIHMSDDVGIDPRYPQMLRCSFRLPSKDAFEKDPDLCLNQVRLAVALIDVIAQVAHWCSKRPNVLAKAAAIRTERTRSIATHEKTQERAQRKRDDKLAKEKEKKENMSDAQLAKYEEKEYRRKMKKQSKTSGGRVKMMKM